LVARPPEALAGLIEIRGIGIRRLPYEPAAVVGLVVDLDAETAERHPERPPLATIAGIELALLSVPRGTEPLPMLLAATRPVE
jgi:serine kinase of HPr protein (carbohydrate metabolism regulator)